MKKWASVGIDKYFKINTFLKKILDSFEKDVG